MLVLTTLHTPGVASAHPAEPPMLSPTVLESPLLSHSLLSGRRSVPQLQLQAEAAQPETDFSDLGHSEYHSLSIMGWDQTMV